MDPLSRLRRLFTQDFRAIDVASPLLSFDAERECAIVARWMDATATPVVGIRIGGLVGGYAMRADLDDGICRDAMRPFGAGQVRDESAGLAAAVAALDRHPFCFLSTLGTVDAFLTRHDLEKPQGRMWLFGMITMIEIALAGRIAEHFPRDTWREHLSPGRLRKAEGIRDERSRRNRAAELVDCLQLSDKARVLAADPEIRAEAGFTSKRAAFDWIKRLESLRNVLAHSQDLVTHDWDAIAGLAGRLERILDRNARAALRRD
jgi:hypothetical protein